MYVPCIFQRCITNIFINYILCNVQRDLILRCGLILRNADPHDAAHVSKILILPRDDPFPPLAIIVRQKEPAYYVV